jgi:hypothetical protein
MLQALGLDRIPNRHSHHSHAWAARSNPQKLMKSRQANHQSSRNGSTADPDWKAVA